MSKGKHFTFKSELDKSLHTLEGILIGIAIDKIITRDEINELTNWCSLNREFIDRNPFNELIPFLEESISDNELTNDEIQDILWVCNNFKSDSVYYDIVTSDIQKLHGLIHGILSDNVITNDEIYKFQYWLEDNKHLADTYPYDELYSLVTSIISDGKIDEDERKQLKIFLSEFVDTTVSYNINQKEIDTLKDNIKINGICVLNPNVVILNNTFCFTGTSSRTKRSEIKEIIESLGGIFSNSITKKTRYLVIGDEGNPCWAFACYGRKVEKAVANRKEGLPIQIIHENDFWKYVEDVKVG